MTTVALATPGPPIFKARSSAGEFVDHIVGSDPGLNRFRLALQSVVTIGVILGAEWLFVHFTHALQTPTQGAKLSPAAAAQVAEGNHQFLVISMLLGAIVGMISSMGVMDPTAKGQLMTMLFLPFPMIAALSLGIALGGHRVVSLTSLAVILAAGTYCRRFGPRGLVAGFALFIGDFFGFFLHGAVTMSDLGWLSAELGVGLVVAIAVRFAGFFPHPAKALARTHRSYAARSRKVVAAALELFEDPEHSDRRIRRFQRQLVRLNEAALMIDSLMGDPGALADGSSGQVLHQRLFDAELALTNVARFAQAMARLDLPADRHELVRLALLDLIQRDGPGAIAHARALIALSGRAAPIDQERREIVLTHRFATSVIDLAGAMVDWSWLPTGAHSDQATFQSPVMLFGGWLPGSAQVSAAASLERGHRWGDRVTLAPYTRTAIQMGLAVGGAIALGDVLSGRRFYWAVIAAFVTFMGANNSGEQTRKAVFRVLGTLVGIGVGSLLAHLVGHRGLLSIAVILASLFLGFYLMRINYAFMVIAITVMVSQLYVQLDEFTNSLLVLRLEETAIGAAVTIAVVTLIFPLRTRRVLRIALRAHIQAVAQLVGHAAASLMGQDDETSTMLRADARAVDASYQTLVATVQPLRRSLLGDIDETIDSVMRMAGALRNYGRNLVVDVEATGVLDAETRHYIAQGRHTLGDSLEVVALALNGSRDVTYTRSSSLFDRAGRQMEASCVDLSHGLLAIRDLTLIDGATARLAELMHLGVADYDTARADPRADLEHSET